MRKYLLFIFVFIFALFICETAAQEEQEKADTLDTEEKWESDTLDTAEDWDDEAEEWDDECEDEDFDNEWSWHNEDFMDFEFNGRPTMELLYLQSDMGLKSIGSKFNKAGAAGVRLGYSTLRDYEDYIIRYKNGFIFLSNFSKDFKPKDEETAKLNAELWRFGFGTMNGYGYKFGGSAIIPYQTNSMVWTRFDIKKPSGVLHTLTPADSAEENMLDQYNGTFRFGQMTEAGIRVQVIPLLSLNAGFERSLVFSRFMVWKQLGSAVIEWAGLGAADFFVREVLDSSPAAGPIINFLLKNAVTFGMYQLRRDKMAWPFDTAAPLTIDSWKFGVTFTF